MTAKFNGGLGAVICDRCGIMIALGFRPSLVYCYTTTASDHLSSEASDFCSRRCQDASSEPSETSS